MRTTINIDIDDDILAAAKDLAKAEARTMGHVISELARRGLTGPSFAGQPGLASTIKNRVASVLTDWCLTD